MAEAKFQEMYALLMNPEEVSEETTKFQVLEEEDNFEMMECNYEKQK